MNKVTRAQAKTIFLFIYSLNFVPKGIRTPVIAVKGQCPRPLDDGDISGGAKRDRTADLLHAMQALSQLSYSPAQRLNILGSTAPEVNRNSLLTPF